MNSSSHLVENIVIRDFESQLSDEKVTNYLQPLRYEIDSEYLKEAKVIALYMPIQWIDMTRKIVFQDHKKWQIRVLLENLVMEYPNIYGFYLDEQSYFGNEPFLFLDKEEFNSNPDFLHEISLSIVKLFKEYNLIHNWGWDSSVISSFYFNPRIETISLSEVIPKKYKMAVLNGYFTSKLCINPLTVSLELFKQEENSEGNGKERVWKVINEELYFSHACGGGSDHEAISLPFEIEGGYCSFVLAFNYYEPVDEQGKYYINLNTSVRQWVTAPVSLDYKKYKSSLSLYIGKFIKDGASNLICTSISYIRKNQKNEYEYKVPGVHQEFLHRHAIGIREVLDDVQNGKSIDELFVGIPVANSTKTWWVNHYKMNLTGNGVTIEEDRQFYEKIGGLIEGLRYVKGFKPVTSKQFSILAKDTSKKILFSNMIVPEKVKVITLNVFTAEECHMSDFRKILLNEIQDKGGEVLFPFKDMEDCHVKFHNGVVKIKLNKVLLKTAHQLYETSDNEKLTDIINEVSSFINQATYELNLFFIPAYQKLRETLMGTDPKNIIRKAFLRLNSHVQFINYQPSKENEYLKKLDEDKSKLHRFRNALLDSMSKLGIEQGLKNFNVQSKEDALLIKDTVELGILPKKVGKKEFLFFTKCEHGNIFIKAAGVTDWFAYTEISKLFNKLTDVSVRSPWADETFIMNHLVTEISEIQKSAILYFTANLRGRLPWLRNSNFGKLGNPLLLKFDNISIIRVNDWDDVPGYFTRKIKENKWINSQQSGLFQGSETVYFSLANRGDQIFGQLGKSRFDIENAQNFKKKRLVELAIISNNSKFSLTELANLVHNRRRVNISYDSFTNYPQPLFWVEQIVKDYDNIN
ncbi:DUF3893 domain-containing protein [Fictibacillus sp. 23RED33]|uniref:RNaseH domain-containing protein n=1 Tax=Fictibacillus sp. 23RED33 TaxID=2745879 RepID=UPI0018CCE274|nr:RNaseH domain-containing protein [Fictibacillus sp. 23RED33]MBH0173642.1 DUF3893 domain-containing protein [Fictibacillus sp. 23RED33]